MNHKFAPIIWTWINLSSGNRTSARVNFGTRTSTQISKHFINFGKYKFWHKSLTSAHVILLHYAEVNIPMELGAEINITCRSPQVGAELNPCRSYSCRTSIAPLELCLALRFLLGTFSSFLQDFAILQILWKLLSSRIGRKPYLEGQDHWIHVMAK